MLLKRSNSLDPINLNICMLYLFGDSNLVDCPPVSKLMNLVLILQCNTMQNFQIVISGRSYRWSISHLLSACWRCMLHLAHLRHFEWANKVHIQCGNHISQSHILQIHKIVRQLANQPKMTKVYRDRRDNFRQNLSFRCRMLKMLSLGCRMLKIL